MKHITKNSRTISLALFVWLFFTFPLKAEETIPIPHDRPDVLNVSPSYIKQLRERRAQEQQDLQGIQKEDDSLLPLPNESDPQKTLDEKTKSEVLDIDSHDLLDVLENKPIKKQKEHPTLKKEKKTKPIQGNVVADVTIPIPKRKPSEFNDIEPSAHGTKNTESIEDNYSETLVSFAMKPEQITLDESLKSFLNEHAVRLFQENKNLKMEIYAYATPIDGEIHSEVRISLARALEVRSFLISKNIPPNRLKLSPMGSDQKNDTDDRIDLLFIDRSLEN
ncbi:MAG: OmpA family protein [Alphaproteobacteria bacterium]|nr:OmpA family protein [Alphaproteobacteria bacterium]